MQGTDDGEPGVGQRPRSESRLARQMGTAQGRFTGEAGDGLGRTKEDA